MHCHCEIAFSSHASPYVSSNSDVISLINIITNLLLYCFVLVFNQVSYVGGWRKPILWLQESNKLLKTFTIHDIDGTQVSHYHHCNSFADCIGLFTGAGSFFRKYVQLSLLISIFSRKGTVDRLLPLKVLLHRICSTMICETWMAQLAFYWGIFLLEKFPHFTFSLMCFSTQSGSLTSITSSLSSSSSIIKQTADC